MKYLDDFLSLCGNFEEIEITNLFYRFGTNNKVKFTCTLNEFDFRVPYVMFHRVRLKFEGHHLGS